MGHTSMCQFHTGLSRFLTAASYCRNTVVTFFNSSVSTKIFWHFHQLLVTTLNILHLRLLAPLSCALLFFPKFDNHVLLVGNLVPQGSNLGVLGVLVLFTPANCCLEIFYLMSQLLSFSGNLDRSLDARSYGMINLPCFQLAGSH